MDPNQPPSEPINPFPDETPTAPVLNSEESPKGDKMNKASGFLADMITKFYEPILRGIVGMAISVLKLIRYFIQQFISQVFSR